MGNTDFLAEFNRMATQNHVLFVNERKLTELLRDEIARGDSFVNVFNGTDKQVVMMTSGAVAAFKNATFGMKLLWKLDIAEIESARATRRVASGYITDALEIYSRSGRATSFRFGFNSQYNFARAEVSDANADVAAEQLNSILEDASHAVVSPLNSGESPFDIDGPESSGSAARAAANAGDWDQAFTCYVRSIDQLHDFYVFENFRNRQPGPRDAWLIEGLVESLRNLRRDYPSADVRARVREATHRLRTISTSCDQAGGNSTLYRSGLQQLGLETPEIDVSGIYWS